MKNNADIITLKSSLENFKKGINTTMDETLKTVYKECLTKSVNALYRIERLDRKIYEEILISSGIEKDKLEKLNIDNAYVEYIEENILNTKNVDMCNQFNSLNIGLDEILANKENINKEELEIWIENYKKFVVSYDLDLDMMQEYLKDKLVKAGLENEEEIINIYINTTIIEEKIKNDDITVTEEVVKNDNVTVTEEKIKNDDITVTEEVVKNDDVTVTEEKIKNDDITVTEEVVKNDDVTVTEEKIKNDDITVTEEVVKNDDVTVTEEKIKNDATTVPQEEVKNDNDEPKNVVPTNISDIENNEIEEAREKSDEPLKIVSIKYSKKEKTAAISSVLASWMLVPAILPPVLICNLFYNLHKKRKVKNEVKNGENVYEIDKKKWKDFEKFLTENNLAINNEGLLVDVEKGEFITEERIEKEKFDLIKRELVRMKAPECGRFNLKYQFEKYKSLLCNTKPNKTDDEEMIMGGRTK